MKLCKRSIAAVAGLIASILMIAAAAAQSPSRLDEIIQRGTLRVGMTGDYKPFSYYDPTTNSFSGLDVEMAEALGKALGVKVVYVHTAWPQLMKDFEADQFDIAMGGISITLDRQRKGLFSTPIMREGKTPIARCTDASKYGTLDDIDQPGTRIITNPGGTNERFARANAAAADIIVHNDNNTIFDEIVNGKADLMMTDSSETLYQQKLKPQLCAINPDRPFDFAEKAFLLPRDSVLKAFVDQWLHIARETGVSKSIYDKWLQ